MRILLQYSTINYNFMRQVTFVFMLKVTNANDSLLIIKSGQDQLERKELNEREMKIRQSCRVRFRN